MPPSAFLADTPVTRFFREFERRASIGEAAAQAALFGDIFLVASPQGAKCVRASDFPLVLSKRKELFDKLGCRSTELAALDEIPLDARYSLVRTRWRMEFAQPSRDAQSVLVSSVFIVDTSPSEFKILLYLANQDIMEVLKEHGILAQVRHESDEKPANPFIISSGS